MKKTLKRVIAPALVVSLALNLAFVFYIYHEKTMKREDLKDTTNLILSRIEDANKNLSHIHFPFDPEKQKDYRTYLALATSDLDQNEGLLFSHGQELPENLGSWHSRMSTGLDLANSVTVWKPEFKKDFENTIVDIRRFINGYHKEAHGIDPSIHPRQALTKVEDVISNKKYMKDRYVVKGR